MKFLILVPLAAAALSGCTTGKCDTGDSACGSGGGGPSITAYNGECGTGTCEWSVEANGTIGTVEMELIETGDTAFSCGPDKDVVCDVWREQHSAFNSSGGNAKAITLDIVTTVGEQVNNSTTLFDSSAEFNQLTVLFIITDSSGTYADCMVDGNDPGYFSSDCTRVGI